MRLLLLFLIFTPIRRWIYKFKKVKKLYKNRKIKYEIIITLIFICRINNLSGDSISNSLQRNGSSLNSTTATTTRKPPTPNHSITQTNNGALGNATFMSISNFKTLTPELVRSNTISDMKSAATHNNHKQPGSINTLNQLFALKDIYVSNNSNNKINKFLKKNNPHKNSEHSHPEHGSENSSDNSHNSIKVNSTSHITTNQQQQLSADNARRTRSALPLLKNSLRFNKTFIPSTNSANNSTNISLDQMRNNIVQHENNLTMNLNNCFNASSYKLITTPIMTNLTKTPKKLLCSPNNNSCNIFEKTNRRENSSINKTSLWSAFY